jgi:hypothetical protein
VTGEPLRIVIELHVDGDEMSGHAGDESGERRPFNGWLGLIAALDRLIDVSKLRPTPSE